MKTLRSQLKRFLYMVFVRNYGVKILSLVLAILLWSFAVAANPQVDKSIANVPVNFIGVEDLAQNGLMVDEAYEKTVLVRLQVDRADQYVISDQDILVKADVSEITQAGMVTVILTATSGKGHIISIEPRQISLPIVVK